jgi:hypothetical protein
VYTLYRQEGRVGDVPERPEIGLVNDDDPCDGGRERDNICAGK